MQKKEKFEKEVVRCFFGGFSSRSMRKEAMPTVLLSPFKQEDGTVIMSPVVLEQQVNPSSVLNWDEYSITNCLKSGVSYKALQLQHDVRIGSDAEIDAFNDMIKDSADKLFVQPNH